MNPAATILIPTTGDRAALLEHALWSIQRQTLPDWELFIIGDGVAPASRERYLAWCAEDPRIHFFDHPKHPRRGEEYRHEALMQKARGRIVCYLCDRDLYLPRHLEVMADLLAEVSFAHSLPVSITEADTMICHFEAAIWDREERFRMGACITPGHGLPLSIAAHRLDFYKQLNPGWSTTPKEIATDIYMWSKFLNHPDCTFRSYLVPTVIYLPRGTHPGWPVDRRLAEMVRWREKMLQPGFYETYLESILESLVTAKIKRGSGTMRAEIHRRLDYKERYYFRRGGLRNTLIGYCVRGAAGILRLFGK